MCYFKKKLSVLNKTIWYKNIFFLIWSNLIQYSYILLINYLILFLIIIIIHIIQNWIESLMVYRFCADNMRQLVEPHSSVKIWLVQPVTENYLNTNQITWLMELAFSPLPFNFPTTRALFEHLAQMTCF